MLKLIKSNAYWVLMALLGILCLFPLDTPDSFKIDETKSPLFTSFPVDLGAWKGKDEPLDERTYEILETRNVLSRSYQNPGGESVHLLLVGSFKDRRVAHPPEVCYLSSNFGIVNERKSSFDWNGQKISLKEFEAIHEKESSAHQHVLYLYRVGNRFTTNYYSQQLQFALDRLSRKESQVLLIRLSGKDEQSFKVFLPEVLAHLESQT